MAGGRPLTSEGLAALIVDALVDAGLVAGDRVEAAIGVTAEEIDARKALGDYDRSGSSPGIALSTSHNLTTRDSVVDEVRAAREAYAKRFNYDLGAIYRDLKEQQRRSGQTYVSLPPRRVAPTGPPPVQQRGEGLALGTEEPSRMTSSQLYELIHADPFRPFLNRMADGREYTVPHPDFIAYPRGARVAFLMKDLEHGILLDLLLMTSLEHITPDTVRQAEGLSPG
jgi:hypothetical protein